MKKLGVFILVSLLLFSFVSAQIEDARDTFVKDIEEFEEKFPKDQEEAEDVASEYLKREWVKILEKNELGKVLLVFSDILKSMSPIFELVIGVEYSLSWFFFLSFGIWIALILIIYYAIKAIVSMETLTAIGISVIIPTFAAQFGIIPMFLEIYMPFFTNDWVIAISLILAMVILYFYTQGMKLLEKYTKKTMKKNKKLRREQKAKFLEKKDDLKLGHKWEGI